MIDLFIISEEVRQAMEKYHARGQDSGNFD